MSAVDIPIGLRLLCDEPVREQDDLGYETLAKAIAGICISTPGPFTVGVFGEWGSGKTSVMRLAQRYVELAQQPKRDVVTVWFDAWQYEREEHPIVPLVGSIVLAIESRKEGLAQKASDAANRLLNVLRAIAYGFSSKTKGTIPGVSELEIQLSGKDAVERYTELNKTPRDILLDGSLYFRAFELLEGFDASLKTVVFIDDLDRCVPKRAMHLLETIKLVLGQKGFLFVVGLAREMLEQYVTKLYRDEYGIQTYASGRSYLDKIVQLPVYLESQPDDFEHYLAALVRKCDLKTDHRLVFESLIPYLGNACHHNPRSAVRLLNNLVLVELDLDFGFRTCEAQHVGSSVRVGPGAIGGWHVPVSRPGRPTARLHSPAARRRPHQRALAQFLCISWSPPDIGQQRQPTHSQLHFLMRRLP